MYSYEDGLRAVRLYIKVGKRIGLTIRQLGYPTMNALEAWHSEYEQRHDLQAVYTRPVNRGNDQVTGLPGRGLGRGSSAGDPPGREQDADEDEVALTQVTPGHRGH